MGRLTCIVTFPSCNDSENPTLLNDPAISLFRNGNFAQQPRSLLIVDLPRANITKQELFVSTASLFPSQAVSLGKLGIPCHQVSQFNVVATNTGVTEIKGCSHHKAVLCFARAFCICRGLKRGLMILQQGCDLSGEMVPAFKYALATHWAAQPGFA